MEPGDDEVFYAAGTPKAADKAESEEAGGLDEEQTSNETGDPQKTEIETAPKENETKASPEVTGKPDESKHEKLEVERDPEDNTESDEEKSHGSNTKPKIQRSRSKFEYGSILEVTSEMISTGAFLSLILLEFVLDKIAQKKWTIGSLIAKDGKNIELKRVGYQEVQIN